MRFHRFRTVLALAAASCGLPALAVAQEQAERPATHTVKKGDTLWDLAKQYLDDPFQWPQIYQLNSELIKDPHWIYPGQVFRLPGGTAAAAAAGAPAPGAPAVGPERPLRTSTMTVFDPRTRASDRGSTQALMIAAARTAVRQGDFQSSPFMWAEGGPEGDGAVIGTADPLGIGIPSEFRPLQLQEAVLLRLPRGMDAPPGTRVLTYRLADKIVGQGQVVVPTGVIRVDAHLEGRNARGTVVGKFEDVFANQGITRLDSLAMEPNVFPQRVEFGMTTRVVWVNGGPILPSAGQKLILAAAAAQGLVPGDQLSLQLPSAGGDVAKLDEVIGVAQVTRVTPWGASAVLIDVRDAGIRAGTRAQVSAKMP